MELQQQDVLVRGEGLRQPLRDDDTVCSLILIFDGKDRAIQVQYSLVLHDGDHVAVPPFLWLLM